MLQMALFGNFIMIWPEDKTNFDIKYDNENIDSEYFAYPFPSKLFYLRFYVFATHGRAHHHQFSLSIINPLL